MALRDHSLDKKIADAAMGEFLSKGYRGASLRKIAEAAGVTVGAIQIRYKSKDELFSQLIKPLTDDIETLFESVKTDYFGESDADFLTKLEISMKNESAVIMRLIFDRYDQATLLLSKSAGSGSERYYDEIVKKKIEESARFFRSANRPHIDEKLLSFLISLQFESYRRIVGECLDRETAEKYMDSIMTYNLGGWTALFGANEKK